MTKHALRLLVVVMVVTLCVPAAWAQQKEKDPRLNPPIQPVGESSSKTPAEGSPPAAAPALTPDQRPLSGVEDFSLGSFGGRSFLTAGLNVFQRMDSRSNSVPGSGTDVNGATSVFGTVALNKLFGRSTVTLDYATGGLLYNSDVASSAPMHKLGFSTSIQGRRWTATINDYLTYLPESPFGFNGFGTPGLNFGNVPTVGPNSSPAQNIFAGTGSRLANTLVGQMNYQFSPRSSFTTSASYGVLRFFESGLNESNQYGFTGGYNYALNAEDSISVSYGASLVRFLGFNQAFDSHSVQLGYGRRITGRLAFRVAAGTQVSQFDNPLAGDSTSLTWNASTSMTYAWPRSTLGLTYNRYTNAGSGVLVGATSHTIRGTLGRQLTRMWSTSFNGGYSRSTGLEQTNPSGRTVFNSWNAGVTANRPLGRYAGLTLNYNFQWQNSGTAVCVAGTCGTRFLAHQIGIGLNFSFRPINLE